MKRLLALVICAALLLALLSGCGKNTGNTGEAGEKPAAAGEMSDETASAPEGEQPLVTDPDSIIAIGHGGTGYATYAPDTIVGSVDGSDVTWMEYYYWLTYYARTLFDSAAENGVELTSWDAVGEMSNDMSNAEVIVTAAQYMTKYYHAIVNGAASNGVELSAQDRADIESIYDSYADENGDGDVSEEEAAAYDTYLAGQCVDKDFLMYLLEVAMLTDVTFDTVFGENGEKYGDDETMAFIEENGFMSAKRIVLLTIDVATGDLLDEATLDAKQDTAEKIQQDLAAVEGTDELIDRFDDYMFEFSEDTGLAEHPDGYVFMNDGSPLTTITEELDENYGLSDAVKTSYGYEIVLRQPVLPDMEAETDADGTVETMRYLAAEWGLQTLVTAWTEMANATWNEGFDSPDLSAIFG